MRTLRGTIIGAVTLAFAAIAPPPVASAAPPSAPYNALVIDGRHGGLLNGSLAFDSIDDTVEGTAYANGHVRVTGTSAEHSWSAGFAPPLEQKFEAGKTYLTHNDLPHWHTAQFGFTGPYGNGCQISQGQLTVHEVVYSGESGQVTAFAGSYKGACKGVLDGIAGEIRWNSTIGYKATVTNPGTVSFSTPELGVEAAAQTITLAGEGTEASVLGTPVIGGTTPGSFRIAAETCSGKTLAFGQTCTISVAGTATAVGLQHGQLLVPDDSTAGDKVVRLSVQMSNKGMYHPVAPHRILDTRSGTGWAARKVNDNETVGLQVLKFAVPEKGVSAVVLNVTVTEADQPGHVTVYPHGVAKPTASSLNYTRGWTGANSVTVKVGDSGLVSLSITGGKLHLIADIVGFYAANDEPKNNYYSNTSGRVFTHEPIRLFDSREVWGEKLPSQDWVKLTAGYTPQVAPHVKAFIVNVTATEPEGAGHLRTWNGAGHPPDVSTLNYERGQTVPNFAIVPATTCDFEDCESLPMMGVYTNTATHVIVDIVGFIDDGTLSGGLRFEPRTPERIVDTRINQGITGRVGQGVTKTVTTPGTIANADTYALALNVTGIQPTVDTNMIVWENGIAKPGVSNLNPAAGQIAPNAVVTGIDELNKFNVYNHGGTIDTVIDVVGTFYWIDGVAGISASARAGTAHLVPDDGLAPAVGSVSRQR